MSSKEDASLKEARKRCVSTCKTLTCIQSDSLSFKLAVLTCEQMKNRTALLEEILSTVPVWKIKDNSLDKPRELASCCIETLHLILAPQSFMWRA